MPRTEYEDGVEYRNIAGEVHRNGDLPAIESNDGDKTWFLNNRVHRIDNPAWVGCDGSNSWWLSNHCYYKSEYYSILYPYKGILLDTSTECQRGRYDNA